MRDLQITVAMKTISKICIVFLLIMCSCKEAPKEKKGMDTRGSADIDEIQLTDLNSQYIDISKYRGNTVFINFWATWCKPCIREMPSLENAQNILKEEKVIFLLASDEELNEIEDFKNNNNYTFNYTRIENLEALNIQELPTTFVYNPEGKLVFSEAGSRSWDDSSNIQMIRKINKQND